MILNNKHILDVVPEYSYKISVSYMTKVQYNTMIQIVLIFVNKDTQALSFIN